MAVSRALFWVAVDPEIPVFFVFRGKEVSNARWQAKSVIDRRVAACNQKYEVGYFAKEHDIKEGDTRGIIKQRGIAPRTQMRFGSLACPRRHRSVLQGPVVRRALMHGESHLTSTQWSLLV
ncbi:hypothetical protein BC361_19725 [Ensifer sp. LC54]|nr:hypothetical protein BC361_19725 [Ensifer sp. LC54]OCP25826.1 hypothetical protein BC363_18810 [Ensifer sp. LC384]